MTPRLTDPAKAGVSVRIHINAKRQAQLAHAAFMGQSGHVISMADFMDLVIEKGIKALALVKG